MRFGGILVPTEFLARDGPKVAPLYAPFGTTEEIRDLPSRFAFRPGTRAARPTLSSIMVR